MWRGILISGITIGFVTTALAQRLQGWDTFADVGFSYGCLQGGSGIGSCQWLTVRGERELPPRTGAKGFIRYIRVANSGEPFGRVLLLWSGWASHSIPDAGYWVKGIEWSSPIYEAAQVGDTFYFGDNTLLGYMWNGSFWRGAYRAVQAGVYVEAAPRPSRQALSSTPTWNIGEYRSRDLLPNRPGVQMDPCLGASCDRQNRCGLGTYINLSFTTGDQRVARPQVLMKRMTGLDQAASEWRNSLFRDDVTLQADLRVNGNTVRSTTGAITFSPGEGGLRTMPFQTGSWYQYGLPRRGVYHIEYDVKMHHIPYDKNGSPIWIVPELTPVEYLRQADRVYFDLRHLYYRAMGAINREGSYSDAELPPVCISKQSGSLDIQLNLQDFGLPYDRWVTLGATVLNNNTVEWSLDELPNECVNVEGVNVLIYRVWGRLRATLQLVPAEPNSLCGRSFNLILTPIGGDDGNQMNGELYALCHHAEFAKIDVQVRQIDYLARSGNPNATTPDNPHLLYSFYDAEDLEFILYGDANGDGKVDDSDLLIVLFEFGCIGRCNGDVNGDNHVDDNDLLTVLFQFGREYGDCCRPCDE
ncbi:MAG: dockerin type I repeat-containing protein [Thermofilaceae archaeon]